MWSFPEAKKNQIASKHVCASSSAQTTFKGLKFLASVSDASFVSTLCGRPSI